MYIYRITDLIFNKSYIGKREASNDFKNDNNYFGSGSLINQMINKYGKENFKKELIEDNINNVTLLNFKESYYIEAFDTLCPNGYNLTNGGDGGDTFKNDPNKEQRRKKIGDAGRGRIFSEQRRKNIGASRKNKTHEEIYGVEESKRLREHLSKVNTGKKRGNYEEYYGVERAKEIKKKKAEGIKRYYDSHPKIPK